MSDFNSSQPIRTENAGDVSVKVVDGTVTSQALNVDSSGRVSVKNLDGSGVAITSQANGAQRAMDVGVNVAGVQVDPRSIRALTSTDVVTAIQGTANTSANAWPHKITDGTNVAAVKAASTAAVASDPALVVAISPNNSLTVSNPSVGTTGTTPPTSASLAGGSVTTAAPTYTTGQMSPLSLSTGGLLRVDGSGVTQPVSGTVTANIGTSGSLALDATLTGGTQKTKLVDTGGTNVATIKAASTAAVATDTALVVAISPNNAMPVTVSVTGTEINDYNTTSALAAAATSNHDYSVTAAKTFKGRTLWASASGKMKIEVQTSPDNVTFTTKWVGFNSTANPNICIPLGELAFSISGATAKVRIIRTNKDSTAQDVYSTISGTEV